MRTRDLVALAVAGIIGVSGGIGAGVWNSQDETATVPPPAATPGEEDPEPAASTGRQPLLYATADAVVEGGRRIPHDLGVLPLVVVRAEGGYVLSAGSGSGLGDRQRLVLVTSDAPVDVEAVLESARTLARDPSQARQAPLALPASLNQTSLTVEKVP